MQAVVASHHRQHRLSIDWTTVYPTAPSYVTADAYWWLHLLNLSSTYYPSLRVITGLMMYQLRLSIDTTCLDNIWVLLEGLLRDPWGVIPRHIQREYTL